MKEQKKENKKKKDEEFEIRFLEGILEKSPNFLEALINLGDLYTKHGFYEKGLSVDQRLARMRPEDPIIFYNLACSYSLLNDIEKAFQTVKVAIKNGYHDFKHMQKDKDIERLRQYAPFKELLSKIIEKVKLKA